MKFTNDWFTPQIPTWNNIIPQYNPKRIIEIGSFEGRSVCHLIELLGNQNNLEIYCIDTLKYALTAMLLSKFPW